jgi:hypothetical protein
MRSLPCPLFGAPTGVALVGTLFVLCWRRPITLRNTALPGSTMLVRIRTGLYGVPAHRPFAL